MNELVKTIDEFENKLSEAIQFKYKLFYKEHGESIANNSVLNRIRIKDFFDAYLKQNYYPYERVGKLVYYLFDFKIQLFFILELDLGLYNHLIYNLGYDYSSIVEIPYIFLRKLSLDQNLILKSRILWERIMNFIYFLEVGKELESSSKKSKKTKFFEFIKNNKWSFLLKYKEYIDWFDKKLRTPEVHKFSILRKNFQRGITVPSEKVDAFVNIMMNVFWKNMLHIIKGENPPIRYWDIGIN